MGEVLLKKNYLVCLGDCYSNDPHINKADFHVRTLLRAVSGGSVLIVHCPEKDRRQQTLEVLPQLVRGLREKGFDLATLGELFPMEMTGHFGARPSRELKVELQKPVGIVFEDSTEGGVYVESFMP